VESKKYILTVTTQGGMFIRKEPDLKAQTLGAIPFNRIVKAAERKEVADQVWFNLNTGGWVCASRGITSYMDVDVESAASIPAGEKQEVLATLKALIAKIEAW
jgi:hypothetical protein